MTKNWFFDVFAFHLESCCVEYSEYSEAYAAGACYFNILYVFNGS